jgi:basic membrane protein A
MRRFTTASLALTIAATGVFAGAAAVAAQDDPRPWIGVVTDVGQLEDKSFNQFSNAGAVDAAAATGGTHRVIVTEEIADYDANIGTFVDEGFDAITTVGYLIGSNTLDAALANPDVFFSGIDQFICVNEEGQPDVPADGSDPTCAGDAAAAVPNYQGIIFNEAQPGFMVGVVAAHLSETGVIGAVGGTNLPAVVAFRDGYYNGAIWANPDIEVLYTETDPKAEIGFNSPERGAEIAGQMLDLDADVIFQIAGGTGVGALEVTCAEGAYGIGVDVDQSQSLPTQAAECVVTSAEKKLQDTVNAVVSSTQDGSFQGGNAFYNLASDPPGVGISPFQEKYADLLTDELQADLDAAVAGMIDGSIDPAAATGL